MTVFCLYLSAALVALTCLVHSVLGERRLIGPLLRLRVGVLEKDLARQVLRFVWHLVTAMGLMMTWVLLTAAQNPLGIDRALILLIGGVLAGAGLIDAFYTRGKHVGWPLLTMAGASALAALL